MIQQTAINISLHIENRVFDLRVPRYVSCDRLQELLQDALAEYPIQFPQQWELEVLDKQVRLGERVLLKDYPISDGDHLAVVFQDSRSKTVSRRQDPTGEGINDEENI